jgi:L-amino acid N-acyltransferase YncA
MAGTFSLKQFSDIDLNDPFFDSLKEDYPIGGRVKPFEIWFPEKAHKGRTALVFEDEDGVGAFICIKHEAESIPLQDRTLQKEDRCKVTTIKIAERYRGQRIGEGAIGLLLWKWQKMGWDEIYVTVFDKHELLISQLKRFGFVKVGYNLNGEGVYMRSRSNVDYSDPYKSFPFVNPYFQNAGYLLVNDYYHDTLFPYSELRNTLQTSVALNVRNGLTKIYVGRQYSVPPYKVGEPILIYRIHTGDGQKRYKSCLTSYCIVTKIIAAKRSGTSLLSFDDLLTQIGNKSVYDRNELRTRYDNDKNMFVIEMLYYGFFGEGNNVNMDWLDSNGYWSTAHGGQYPALIRLTPGEFKEILREGNVDVDNVIID